MSKLIDPFCQTSIKSSDQIDLLREQQKILSGEVALHSSALKRLSDEVARNPQKDQIHVRAYYPRAKCLRSINLSKHFSLMVLLLLSLR